ncbi:Acireductone dioxygenase [Boletus coccyginus]|nr:Acireductone dioxygenase [Boletus coccyginus]
MRAYYFDGLPGDQTLPHDSGAPASNAALAAIGVLLWHVPIPIAETSNYKAVDIIARNREYKTIETMTVTKESLGDRYEEQLKVFYSEHMHEDEEIRYILEGGGFFDVHEQATDKWIRFVVDAGDLVLLPAGIYHRFTLDERNMIKARMFFKARLHNTTHSVHSHIIYLFSQDRLKWVPHYRSEVADNNPYRMQYLQSML